MSNIKVTKVTSNQYHVKIDEPQRYKVVTEYMARRLRELLDVNVSGVSDKYVIMYDSVTGKYVAVNPDEVLSAASNTELTSPGLPQNFVNTLDVDLDDKIDLDAGSW